MNRTIQIFSIAEAAGHPKLALMTLADIEVSEATIKAMVARFLWPLELGSDSDPALLRAAETDVRGDAELFVKLAGRALVFSEWFKRDDWSIYEVSEVLGDDAAWPLGVLERAKLLVEAEGSSLAS
jgi:hypothetical protein